MIRIFEGRMGPSTNVMMLEYLQHTKMAVIREKAAYKLCRYYWNKRDSTGACIRLYGMLVSYRRVLLFSDSDLTFREPPFLILLATATFNSSNADTQFYDKWAEKFPDLKPPGEGGEWLMYNL
jgi:hypothetical protein